jgi:hypothetical protein
VLDKIDPRSKSSRSADFSPQFARATVNKNAARQFACILTHLFHVTAELSKVVKRRGVLFALHDDGSSEFVDE